jgi:cell division protein FtsW
MVLFFLVFGEIMLFSATGVMGLQRYGSEFYYLSRQTVVAVLGLLVLFSLAHIRYTVWRKLALPLLIFQLVITSITLFSSYALEASGASRWISFGSFRFQPSEFAKITVPIYFCHLVARHKERGLSRNTWIITGLPVVALLFTLLKQPDLGTTGILCVVMFGVVFLSGLSLRYVVATLGTGIVLFTISLFASEYRRRRLFAFMNPWADPQGSGFQVIQSFLSFHSGKLFGVGLGNGNSKLFYLPEVHTDFIFALVGEELGFVGAVALLAAFFYFSFLLFKVTSKISEPFGGYLAFALTLGLVLQIGINLGGVVGLLPVKGLPLPFISWGRSALVANLAMVGILLNILKQSEIIDDKSK